MQLLDWYVNNISGDPAQHVRNIPLIFDADSHHTLDQQIAEAFPGIEPAPPGDFALWLDHELVYKDLPPVQPVAYAIHLGERVFIYPAGFIVILQLSGSFKVYRLI